jgi:hypothetical protein
MTARNNITSQTKASPAALFAKHADTIKLLASSVHGMKQANDTIESAKAVQAKCVESIKLAVKALRADKVVMGDARNCPFTRGMADTFAGFGLAKSTVSNYLVDVKRAVNEGETFTLNSARKAAEAKKAAAEKAAALAATAAEQSAAVKEAMQGPADLVPPAAESREGQNVKLHTNDTVNYARNEDGNNGPDVQHLPSTTAHDKVVANLRVAHTCLGTVAAGLRSLNMRLSSEEVESMQEAVRSIEQQVLAALGK